MSHSHAEQVAKVIYETLGKYSNNKSINNPHKPDKKEDSKKPKNTKPSLPKNDSEQDQ